MKKRNFTVLAILFFILLSGCQVGMEDSIPADQNTVAVEKEIITGEEAGLLLESYPQINVISVEKMENILEIGDTPETGVYLVGIDYVPVNIEKLLAEENLTLESDGTLLNEDGLPVSLFVEDQVARITPF